ncbi:uncharacterized protein LOC118919297 isoform X1 [Manis pentadactyla]|uniref:uncharacterized protein LOC118919297 isoform X1 n=1 Tax=Manis pentadactyla TaxID=143292 RepID=UPI00255CF2E0|nr:uncharacterized protein LOC118919297 isoform X1 [Manis pentadactyla]XP_057353767.1 uncharacterized protein LOC118919297 isoform X1 [Manis pentadactyla]XP_057353768.1 uncharacterized protein LOC118919297 isoform X1 [Manis pentadactyla]XP_057353769.1 uncharacterized protein LOC118919297 isoform X1 [Manis pentadactyla]XP_057353770.1 uncharacterized protein LOC118919297 isoform X1 [Manis pentadactyla]XP_057353771.1 uncharacterized protein LOC118919297 isoform X1 [Manis pentadactyla]
MLTDTVRKLRRLGAGAASAALGRSLGGRRPLWAPGSLTCGKTAAGRYFHSPPSVVKANILFRFLSGSGSRSIKNDPGCLGSWPGVSLWSNGDDTFQLWEIFDVYSSAIQEKRPSLCWREMSMDKRVSFLWKNKCAVEVLLVSERWYLTGILETLGQAAVYNLLTTEGQHGKEAPKISPGSCCLLSIMQGLQTPIHASAGDREKFQSIGREFQQAVLLKHTGNLTNL